MQWNIYIIIHYIMTKQWFKPHTVIHTHYPGCLFKIVEAEFLEVHEATCHCFLNKLLSSNFCSICESKCSDWQIAVQHFLTSDLQDTLRCKSFTLHRTFLRACEEKAFLGTALMGHNMTKIALQNWLCWSLLFFRTIEGIDYTYINIIGNFACASRSSSMYVCVCVRSALLWTSVNDPRSVVWSAVLGGWTKPLLLSYQSMTLGDWNPRWSSSYNFAEISTCFKRFQPFLTLFGCNISLWSLCRSCSQQEPCGCSASLDVLYFTVRKRGGFCACQLQWIKRIPSFQSRNSTPIADDKDVMQTFAVILEAGRPWFPLSSSCETSNSQQM